MSAKQERCKLVNQVIRIIGCHGRQFFYNQEHDRFASMEVDKRGKVWFVDDYSGKRIYTHATGIGGKWRGFTHGGTLRALVEQLRDFICTGKKLCPSVLGPERERMTDGNIWGYDAEEMAAVRVRAGVLPVFIQAGDDQ